MAAPPDVLVEGTVPTPSRTGKQAAHGELAGLRRGTIWEDQQLSQRERRVREGYTERASEIC